MLLKLTTGDEIWTSFGSFPQEMAYFRLDVNNTDGMKSTDLAITENEIILLNKESAPCRPKKEKVFLFFRVKGNWVFQAKT